MRTVYYYAIHSYIVMHVGCGNDDNQNVATSKPGNPKAKTQNWNVEEFSAYSSTTGSSTEHNTVSSVSVPPVNLIPAHAPPKVFPLSRRVPPVQPNKHGQSHSTVSKSSDELSQKPSLLGSQPGTHTTSALAPGTTVPISGTSGGIRPSPVDELSEDSEDSSATHTLPLGGVVTPVPSDHPPASQTNTTDSESSEDSDDPLLSHHSEEVIPEVVQPEEVPFTDEFDESDAAGHPRAVPPAPVASAYIGLNAIGQFIQEGRQSDHILAQFAQVLAAKVDRNTGQYVARYGGNHMQFWGESNGPVLLQRATNFVDCGIDVINEHSQKTLCYVLMMLATSVPFDPQTYKPRDVARHIGLTQFCEDNADGIRIELQNRATDPDDFGHATDFDPLLPQFRFPEAQVVQEGITKAFAANWLSFCPNLIQEDRVPQETRILVFRHSVFRMQIASLHDGLGLGFGRVDQGIDLNGVVRGRVFLDAITEPDGVLLTRRIQTLRYPVAEIHFADLEAGAHGVGVKQEWVVIMGKEMFVYNATAENGENDDPNRHLFDILDGFAQLHFDDDPEDGFLNPIRREILDRYYKAAGRYIGYSIINRYQIPEDLSLMFYAKLMSRTIGWQAIKLYSQGAYNLWNQCLETGASPNGPGDCLFCVANINAPLDEWPESHADREAILNREIMKFATPTHVNAFRALSGGIYEVVPKHIFECGITTKDFREIIFGKISVDTDDLIHNFRFVGGYHAASPQIGWLATYIREFNQQQVQQFVEFITGRKRPGPGGFAANPITISLVHANNLNFLPEAHTCTGTFDLPPYESEQQFRAKILQLADAGHGFLIV